VDSQFQGFVTSFRFRGTRRGEGFLPPIGYISVVVLVQAYADIYRWRKIKEACPSRG